MAVLAVAFVVLAAVPAALTDSDATTESKTYTIDGDTAAAKLKGANDGYWTIESTTITLATNVVLDVTKDGTCDTLTKINVGAYTLTIKGDGKLTLSAMSTISGTGSIIISGNLVAKDGAALSIAPKAEISGELTANNGVTFSEDSTISGKINGAVTNQQAKKMVLNGATISNSSGTALTNTLAGGTIAGSATLTAGAAASLVTVAAGTVDLEFLGNAITSSTDLVSIAAATDLALKVGNAEMSIGAMTGGKITCDASTKLFTVTGAATGVSGVIDGDIKFATSLTFDSDEYTVVLGTVDASTSSTITSCASKIAVVGTLKLSAAPNSIMVLDYGGKLYSSSTQEYSGDYYKTNQLGTVSDAKDLLTVLVAAKKAPATGTEQDQKTIILGGSISDLSDDLTIPEGITLSLGSNNYAINIPEGKKLINEGTLGATGDNGTIKSAAKAHTFFENSGSVVLAKLTGDGGSDVTLTLTNIAGTFEVSVDYSNTTLTGMTISGKRMVQDGTDNTSVVGTAKALIVDGISVEKEIAFTNEAGLTFKDVNLVSGANIAFDGLTGTGAVLNGVSVNSSAILEFKDAEVTASGNVYVYGAIKGITDGTEVTVAKNSTLKMYSGSTMNDITLTPTDSTSKIDVAQAQRTSEQGQDIGKGKTFGALENVVVIGTLNIWNNSTVIVEGGFSVDAGVTLTIEAGSTLQIESATADVKIAGTIVVEEGATFNIVNAASVEISGEIKSEGIVDIDKATTVKTGGAITALDSDTANIAIDGLTIEAGATLTVKSDMTITEVKNKGTVILNGAVLGGDSKIAMAADRAVADIQSVSGAHKLTITDKDIQFTTDKKADKTNTVGFTLDAKNALKGLYVAEKITSSSSSYTNSMVVSGSVSLAATGDDEPVAQSIELTAGKSIAVSDSLELGKNVSITLTGKVSVSGTVEAMSDTGSIITVGADSDISVSGVIQTYKTIATPENGLNAVQYAYQDGSTDCYRYSTMAKAVEDGAETITVIGTVKVTSDLTIPVGTTVKGGKIEIGTSTNRDVTLTVSDGANMKSSSITVYGTLYYENKKNGSGADITSDVSIVGDYDARYTNIYTALSNAESGDVITITKTDAVELNSDITIKEGVTLDVPSSKSLKIVKPITVTVNGTLKSAEAISVDGTDATGFAAKASTTDKKAAIVLGADGIVMIAAGAGSDSLYSTYYIAGAYFRMADSVGDYYYITNVPYAASVVTDTKAISVDGTDYNVILRGSLTVGDVAFSGNSSGNVKVLYARGASSDALTASSVTLSKATFVSSAKFTGDVVVGSSAATLTKVSYVKADSTVSKDGFTLYVTVDADNVEGASAVVSKGSVCVASADSITVASGATMNATSQSSGSAVTSAVVDGTLDIAAGRTMKIETLSVNGSVVAQPESDGKKSALTVTNLYVGVNADDIGAAATVTGEVSVTGYAVVASGATISKETSDLFGKKYTEFYVGSTKWITVYDMAGTKKISDFKNAPVTNAYFADQWLDADGNEVSSTALVGSANKVYADVDYQIYQVVIMADNGIGDLYLNGNIMQKGYVQYTDSKTGVSYNYYAYTATVEAGTYEVTCKLANGYSGTAVLKDMDGKTLSGNKFTASGNPAGSDRTVALDYQLTGIEKSGYVDPVEPEKKDNSLTVTDYLLIVLVILVVVLAVIVAMRLMRS